MARYTGPKSRIARKFGEGIFEQIKFCLRRTILPDSTVIPEKKTSNMVFNFVRNRKKNTPMEF